MPTYCVALILLTAVSILRQSGVSATNTIWAEDGTVFYGQVWTHSGLGTLFAPYGGYLQFYPRLIFLFVKVVPTADVASVVAIVGAVSLAAISLFVFHASRGAIPSLLGRSLLVGTMVLLPLASGELLNNVVNVTWWLFFAAFWALLWRPRTLIGIILGGIICFLAAGTDPLVGLFLPLALARFYVLGWKESSAPLGLVLGLGYQVVGVLSSANQSTFASASTIGIPRILGTRLGLGWIAGNRIGNHVVESSSQLWPVLGTALLLLILAVAVVLRDRRVLIFVMTSWAFAVVLVAIPVWVRGEGPAMIDAPVVNGGRYLATPILLIWSAVIAEATCLSIHGRSTVRHLGIALCCLSLLPVWIVDFRTPNGRSDGPLWSNQVAAARLACHTNRTSTQGIKISPAGWLSVVPCSHLYNPSEPRESLHHAP